MPRALPLLAAALAACAPQAQPDAPAARPDAAEAGEEQELSLAEILPPPELGSEEALDPRPAHPPANVLMISIDTLRRDFVGRYDDSGAPSDTPTMDRLLAEGVALDNHRSCSSWTLPSVVCALSGLDATESRFAPADGSYAVPDDVRFLADYLRDEGYTTGLVAANSFLLGNGTVGRSYDHSVSAIAEPADQVITRGLSLLDELQASSDAPWLLHLHFFDPHAPYTPPEGYADDVGPLVGMDIDVLEALYRGEVHFLDDQLGGLLDTLEARGDLENTLVVLWSDHGEQFSEHGNFYHGNSLYPEEVQTIAGFWGEGLEPLPMAGPTAHSDLTPAVLYHLGLEMPFEAWVEELHQPTLLRPRFALRVFEDTIIQAVNIQGKELHYAWSGDAELYDREADPGAQRDLFPQSVEHARGIAQLLGFEVQLLEELYPDREARPIVEE